MADPQLTPKTPTRRWLRRYMPLFTFVAVLLLMLGIMPSALNLPQSNPTTVLEYAPIPPEDEDQPPPQEGSLSTLSLGTSNTVTEGAPEDVDVGPIDTGEGDTPIVKRCVGDPPRQTEDPNSPPCVPFFQGDNGGATFRGVTGEEITVVVYHDAHLSLGGDSGYESTPPSGSICDIDSEPDNPDDEGCINGEGTQDHNSVQIVRALARHFNERFQTYDRHVHFYVYWSSAGGPSGRRSEAQDIFERLKPFAAIDYTLFGDAQAFIEAAVKRQVGVYGSYAMLPNRIYRENAPFLWSFWPDVEHQVAMFHDYVCKRVAPFPVSHSGNEEDNGQPRKIGLLRTTDTSQPGALAFGQAAMERLERGCPNGASLDIVNDYTFPRSGWSIDTHPDAITAARENIAQMQLEGVTTIVWLGGYETEHSKAADEADWYPEWVLAGDVSNDQTEEGGLQNQEAWRYARVMSNHLREDKIEEAPCRQAFREGNPHGSDSDELAACALYRSFFMLFRGIQVAGPFLTPEAVDQGNHAIPRSESENPFVASCFYDPGDFTCVKDSQESWWDSDEENPNGTAETPYGCWRLTNGGLRHLAGNWPEGEDTFEVGEDTPCNTVGDNSSTINPYGPAG